jgi:hypothetical protein
MTVPDRLTSRAAEIGALHLRELPDGREVAVVAVLFGFRVCVGEAGADTYDDAYCFRDLRTAVASVDSWTGEGDLPDGWHRHIGSDRRRPDGDPSREYIAS